ncbi:hypothetical protein [Acidovorax sp. CCYZU-2555]|uniref:hypothetical protein n=1 Tax=Acidovorax sp. CCYZU-2555 TaxID=2835042 RepID=UPI001BCDA3AF|nr:hypothetical protein [Acidovorax sp. CCYZU-2555]MBS7780783.1 hypothetical protein [Acidovorax sp. CCYZU-2555]
MLENGNQGYGLQAGAAWQELQVCAIAYSATAPAGGLLWPLSAQLQQLGYPVLVLDASQTESAATPGLRDLLAEPPWQATGMGPRPTQASVATLPAALGLRQLGGLESLLAYARGYAVVIVHAPVEQLAPLLQGHAMRPLLPLDMQPRGMERSYRQIKHLALHAGLSCIVAGATEAHEPFARRHADTLMSSLAQCAQRHLRMQPLCTRTDPGSPQELRRLALLMLAHAVTLTPGLAATTPASFAPAPVFSQPAWSL